jgi:hypothetical protein
VVQEEATKASKRAQRRAADDETPGEPSDAEGADELRGDPDAPSAPPAAAPLPNRKDRRTAAAKARGDRKRERSENVAIGLDAGELVDDAFVRVTDKISRFGRRHWNVIQWAIGLSLIGGIGYQIYTWRMRSVAASVSDVLFDAALTEDGTLGDPKEQGKPNANGIVEPAPIFENDAARLAAALTAYQKAAEQRPGSAAEGFARLGEAGVLLEQGKAEEAAAVFERVAASGAALANADLRAQALEGRALGLETKGDLPAARHVLEELANVPGYENPALYQQARVAQRQGDLDAAKALLVKLFKALGPPKVAALGGLPERPDFLRERATQLAGVVDPLEKDVKVPQPPIGADAVQQMLKQLQEQGVVTPPATP